MRPVLDAIYGFIAGFVFYMNEIYHVKKHPCKNWTTDQIFDSKTN